MCKCHAVLTMLYTVGRDNKVTCKCNQMLTMLYAGDRDKKSNLEMSPNVNNALCGW